VSCERGGLLVAACKQRRAAATSLRVRQWGAGMEEVGLHRTSALGWLLLAAAAFVIAWRAAALWRVGSLTARSCAGACALLTLAMLSVVWVDRAPFARMRGGAGTVV